MQGSLQHIQGDEEQSTELEIYIECSKMEEAEIVIEAQLQQPTKNGRALFTSPPLKVDRRKILLKDSIRLTFHFQKRQKLLLKVFHISGAGRKERGRVEYVVGELFAWREKGVTKSILTGGGNSIGDMRLQCEKVDKGKQGMVEFDLEVNNLDVGGCPCFFIEADRVRWSLLRIKRRTQICVYESEFQKGKDVKYAHFKKLEDRISRSEADDEDLLIRFEKENSSKQIIGEIKFTLQILKSGKTTRFTIRDKNQNEKGIVFFRNFKYIQKYVLADYIEAGMQMAMVTGIDFTQSNQNEDLDIHLHHFTNKKRSPYEEALHQVGSIVMDYDTDKLVPCYGYGAKVNMPNYNSNNKVEYCFPINGSVDDPNLENVKGIEEGYRKCIPYLQFSGPTYLIPLLKVAMRQCEEMKAEQKEYMILVIMTDGLLNDDINEVKDLLVRCGTLPLSIIIIGIGVGQNGWKLMHELDDDDMNMTDRNGNKTKRDLVQFVQFQKYNNNSQKLAEQVLLQLPRQVVEYHELCHLTPDIYRKEHHHYSQDDLIV